MTNDKTNWQKRLNGEPVPINEGSPEYGFYRVRARDKQGWRAIAYWFAVDDSLRCRLDDQNLNEDQAKEMWHWAAGNPISHELYTSVIAGGPWPDLSGAVTRSTSNMAPDENSFDGYSALVEDLEREAEKLLAAGAAKTQAEADQAADLIDRLSKLGKRGPELRQADPDMTPELREAQRQAQEISTRWLPWIIKTDIYKRLKAIVITPFLVAKKDAERKAREEAAILAKEHEAKVAKLREDAARAGAPMPEPEPPPPAVQERGSTTKAGTRGRAVSLRTVRDVTITDRAAVLAFFADNPLITDLLQTMSERAVRAGVIVPGTAVSERQVAA